MEYLVSWVEEAEEYLKKKDKNNATKIYETSRLSTDRKGS